MRKMISIAAVFGAVLLFGQAAAHASVGQGLLFHDGTTIRTVVVPVSIPDQGTDPFYQVTNGAAGQLGIAGVAPGDGPYHGGAWQVFTVTFNQGVTPYLLSLGPEGGRVGRSGERCLYGSVSLGSATGASGTAAGRSSLIWARAARSCGLSQGRAGIAEPAVLIVETQVDESCRAEAVPHDQEFRSPAVFLCPWPHGAPCVQEPDEVGDVDSCPVLREVGQFWG